MFTSSIVLHRKILTLQTDIWAKCVYLSCTNTYFYTSIMFQRGGIYLVLYIFLMETNSFVLVLFFGIFSYVLNILLPKHCFNHCSPQNKTKFPMPYDKGF